LNKVVDEDDLNQIAKLEKQTIKKDKVTRLIDLNSLERATYMVAVLNTFGVGDEARKKKVDGLILSNFKDEIKPDTSEAVALCYGLNRGYSVFTNKYRLGENEKTVKFELKSQVDYYTIESIYQFVFNGYIADGFPYLDSWCPKVTKKDSPIKKTNYQVLDTLVIGKKKPKVTSSEYLANLLQRFFQKDAETLLKSFVDKIRITVYSDMVEELEEEVYSKDEEIKRLKKENERIKHLETEIAKLKEAQQVYNKFKGESNDYSDKTDSKIEFPE